MTMVKRTVKSATAHHYIAIFKRGLPFGHIMMASKFCNDISNGSGIITLTDKQSAKNNTTITTLYYMGGKHIICRLK